jgi:hypothetical protein
LKTLITAIQRIFERASACSMPLFERWWLEWAKAMKPGTARDSQHLTSWRSAHPVLVAEAQAIGSVAVIRSLGRVGYPVHACSSDPRALGLFSKYASATVVSPAYTDPFYLLWLRSYLDRHRISAIVPSEALLLALRPAFAEFAPLLPCSPDEGILYLGLSKYEVFRALTSSDASNDAHDHLPSSILVDEATPLPSPEDLAALGLPVYIKTDACYAHAPESEATVHRASNADAARVELDRVMSSFSKALIQGHVPGIGVGAFFLIWNGKVIGEFMHRRLHEVPHTGGASSLRESWWQPSIRNDALAKLMCLGWQGVAMMEYRWNPETDEFYLVEMNGRFWGSLHLALYAGVDFPLLLLDSFHGHRPEPITTFPLRVRSRLTIPRDVQYVWSRLKDHRLPLSSRAWSVLEFFLLSFDPKTKSDLLFSGDRLLYWRRLIRFLRTLS